VTSVGTNSATPSGAATAAWAALAPTITVSSVTIASPPVVRFSVKDAAGLPVVGLGNKSQSATATVAGLTNLSFTLAKLVPSAPFTSGGRTFAGEPSRWVSYLVTRPPTVAERTAAPAVTTYGTYPTSDNQGTLVDNGDGSYVYTFYRDVKQAAATVAGLADDAAALKFKADLGDVSFDATLTHRLGIQLGGNAPGTGSNTPAAATSVTAVPMGTPANVVFDFRPDGGAVATTRDVVKQDSCNSCHEGQVLAHGSRKDPNYCVTCHTDQIRYSFSAEATSTNNGYTLTGTTRTTTAVVDGRSLGDFPNMIHKTHMGADLVKKGYNFNASTEGKFNAVRYPQDARNCATCHDGSASATNKTTNGDNWKTAPSALACGSCHDGINFATGLGKTLADNTATFSGHGGQAQADNKLCAICHTADTIAVNHRTNFVTAHNALADQGAAGFAYLIKSATVSGGSLTVTFSIKQDGVAVTTLAVPTLVRNGVNGQMVVPGNFEPIPGFAGGPSLYVAFGSPTDGVTAPADFNVQTSVSLANLLVASGAPKAGSLSNPVVNGAYQADASGYFTATITGDTLGQPVPTGCTKPTAPVVATCVNSAVTATPIVVPSTAGVVSAAILGSFTQKTLAAYPYREAVVTTNPSTSASGGLSRTGLLALKGATGFERRAIIKTAGCDNCHEKLGTSPSFHGGARNDGAVCTVCHNGTFVSRGWSYGSSTFIHSVHASAKRTVPYTWGEGGNYGTLGYPGDVANCESCHLANTVNYGATGDAVQPKLLWTTVGTGTTSAANSSTAPYIAQTAGTKYGLGYAFTLPGRTYSSYTLLDGTVVPAGTAGATGFTREAESASLVISPISAACFSCHDTMSAKNHMKTNGGAIYEPRSTALQKGEACLTCHGAGKEQDAAVVHKK
jgi:OmcA/MtrC family decaheme c-type cytochrome